MAIDTPSSEYKEMKKKWDLPLTLLGGTQAMRDAGIKYLPKEPNESKEAYEVRKQRTFLHNYYRRTIQSLGGQTFIKAVVVKNVPTELQELQWNFDGAGRNLSDVAYDLFVDMMVFGKTHAMMDIPSIEALGITNYADYRQSGLLPYCMVVSPLNLIGWKVTYESGIADLENIRIFTQSVEEDPDDEFEEVIVDRLQIVRKNTVEHYVRRSGGLKTDKDGGWTQEPDSENTLGYVPLHTAYADRTGFLTSNPPLEDLAWLNLRHWQSSSDQNNILHVARVPFILGTGFDEGDFNNAELGINRIVVSSNPEANMKFVEHTGQAINSGRQDLKDIEQAISILGADLIMNKSVSRQTATAREIDRSESLSVIQVALRNLEQLVENLYQTAGMLIGVDASEVSCSIANELSMASEPNPTDALLKLREFGLSEEVILAEAQRRGLLAEYVTAADLDLTLWREEQLQKLQPTDNTDENLTENSDDMSGDTNEESTQEDS